MPPIVHEVLRSPGLPLAAETRAHMEPRFGHDFSRVRVHTDGPAKESASAVRALAYTVGPHIVFGEGSYRPNSLEGQRLLAHELTHVVQQSGSGNDSTSSFPEQLVARKGPAVALQLGRSTSPFEDEAEKIADQVLRDPALSALAEPRPSDRPVVPSRIAKDATSVLQRQQEEPTRRQIRRDQFLRRLSIWPNEALDAWRRLHSGEQSVVVFHMAVRYGSEFASQFLAHAQRRRRPRPVQHWTNVLSLAREELQRRSYRLASVSMGIEHWVHPTGNSLHRILSSRRESSPASPEATPAPAPARTEELPGNPPHIDLPSDPENLFGPVIRTRDNAEFMGYRGRAVEYGDGTVLLYPPGASAPFIYRVYPESAGEIVTYEFYDANGDKAQGIYLAIDPDDVFGPPAEVAP